MSIMIELGRLGVVVGMALHLGAGPVAGQSSAGALPPAGESEGDVAPGAARGGRVSVGDGMSCSWRVTSVEPPFRLLGVNHDVYVRTADGEIVAADGSNRLTRGRPRRDSPPPCWLHPLPRRSSWPTLPPWPPHSADSSR